MNRLCPTSQASQSAERHKHTKQVDMAGALLGKRLLRERLPDQWSGRTKSSCRKLIIQVAQILEFVIINTTCLCCENASYRQHPDIIKFNNVNCLCYYFVQVMPVSVCFRQRTIDETLSPCYDDY